MTRPQMAALLIVNAVVSLIISLTVVLVFARYSASGGSDESPAAAAVVVAQEPEDAAPTATPAAAAEPGPEQPRYVVQSGDSLGSIAGRFGVTLQAIMEANGLDNANYIKIGQELVIPIEGGELPPTPTPRPAATMAAVLTPEGGGAPVVIETIAPATEVDLEYLVVLNQGAQGVALEGWTLEDGRGHRYRFPNLFLWRNGTVQLHTGAGQDSATDLYWGMGEPVWTDPQGKAILRNAQGEVVTEVVVGEKVVSG